MILEDLKELKKEFHNYKNKKYRFGRYGTSEQIRTEFSNGKAFVLKGGLRGLEWSYISFFCILGLVVCLTVWISSMFRYIVGGIFFFFFCTSFGLPFLIKLRKLLVIGPSGVYYRKILSLGSFSWNSVANYERFERTIFIKGGFIVTSLVVIYLSSGAKIRFQSRDYSNKEFFKRPKSLEREMFFILFNVYLRLGRNLYRNREIKLLEDTISKTPEGSQKDKMVALKKKLEAKTKMEEIAEKHIRFFSELNKNDVEYKILLRKKEAGESVEDLIKQNRLYEEQISKKFFEIREERIKWGQSEEGKNLLEELKKMEEKLMAEWAREEVYREPGWLF